MTKKQLLHNLKNNTYCKVDVSKIHGIGVIAIRDIPKGTNPFVGSYRGPYAKFSTKELQGVDSAVLKLIKQVCITVKGNILIPLCGFNRIDVSFCMNHSKTPNIIGDPKADTFNAITDIKKGEELTFDYEEYSGEDTKKFLKK